MYETLQMRHIFLQVKQVGGVHLLTKLKVHDALIKQIVEPVAQHFQFFTSRH
jgi:hypothetical protein